MHSAGVRSSREHEGGTSRDSTLMLAIEKSVEPDVLKMTKMKPEQERQRQRLMKDWTWCDGWLLCGVDLGYIRNCLENEHDGKHLTVSMACSASRESLTMGTCSRARLQQRKWDDGLTLETSETGNWFPIRLECFPLDGHATNGIQPFFTTLFATLVSCLM